MGVRLLVADATPLGGVYTKVCGDFANHVAEGKCPFDVAATWSKMVLT